MIFKGLNCLWFHSYFILSSGGCWKSNSAFSPFLSILYQHQLLNQLHSKLSWTDPAKNGDLWSFLFGWLFVVAGFGWFLVEGFFFWLPLDCFSHEPEIELDLYAHTRAHEFIGPHFITPGCQQALPVGPVAASKCSVTDHWLSLWPLHVRLASALAFK